MKTTELQIFFDSIKYNAELDKKDIAHICSLTKTRPNEQKNDFETVLQLGHFFDPFKTSRPQTGHFSYIN